MAASVPESGRAKDTDHVSHREVQTLGSILQPGSDNLR